MSLLDAVTIKVNRKKKRASTQPTPTSPVLDLADCFSSIAVFFSGGKAIASYKQK